MHKAKERPEPHIFDKDTSSEFFRLLHDINQDFKGLGSPDYHVMGVTIMCFEPSGQITQVYGTIERQKKLEKIYDVLLHNNYLFSINGKAFFEFQKEYKKNVTEIELTGNSIIIRTDIPGIQYVGDMKGRRSKFEADIEMMGTLGDMYNPDRPSWEFDLSYELFAEMKEIRTSFTLYLHTELQEITLNEPKDDYFMPLRFNQKFLTSFKKTTKGKVYMWESGYDENVYVICFHFENKKFSTYSYIKAVFFGE